jgi:hypothetical protein
VAYDEEGNRGQVSNGISVFAEEKPSTQLPTMGFDSDILDKESYPQHQSLPLTADHGDRIIYIVSGVVSGVLLVILSVIVAILLHIRSSKHMKRSSSSQIYVRDVDSSVAGTLRRGNGIFQQNTINETKWQDSDSYSKDSINKSPIPSISDNLSWRYLGPQKAACQESVRDHRVEHASPSSGHPASSSTDSSLYSDSSETSVSAEFMLGSSSALPRISVMEDYTVYRDLSHISHHGTAEDYFSFSQLPDELQGLAMVPYSPGFDTIEKSRRHISLV